MEAHGQHVRNAIKRAVVPSVTAGRPFRAHALHECPDCGLFQSLGDLRPGQVAECRRCNAVLRRRRRNSLTATFALSVAGLLLLAVATAEPLVTFRLTGQERTTSLTHLPVAFEQQGMPLLSIAVLATTLVAPVLRLGLTAAVLGGLRTNISRGALSAMARLRQILKPWAMIDVFLLGMFVAYTRLQALASAEADIGLYALGALMLVVVWSDAWIDEHAMWEAIGRRGLRHDPPGGGPLIGCDACHLATRAQDGEQCPRCEAALRRRKPQPVARTWALVITAAILYVPANVYPVLTVVRLGRGAPSTIVGGVIELIEARMWPLALLVLVASVIVPLLKLLCLSALLIATQLRSGRWLRNRTRLYRFVEVIGRWSMIDVFMAAVLTALVRMGAIGSVTPGYGALAFAAVVITTMFAAISFDPRLAWDEAEAPEPAGVAAPA